MSGKMELKGGAQHVKEMSGGALQVSSKSTRLQARQNHAIALLIAGGTQLEVSQAVGIDDRTLRRWLATDQEFQAQLNAAVAHLRDELITRTVTHLAPQALDVLERGVEAQHGPENFRDQLQAVKEINRVVFPQGQVTKVQVQTQSYFITPTQEELEESAIRVKAIEREVLGPSPGEEDQ